MPSTIRHNTSAVTEEGATSGVMKVEEDHKNTAKSKTVLPPKRLAAKAPSNWLKHIKQCTVYSSPNKTRLTWIL